MAVLRASRWSVLRTPPAVGPPGGWRVGLTEFDLGQDLSGVSLSMGPCTLGAVGWCPFIGLFSQWL
ncbi:MAG: hypothetical protein AAB214_03360 [Fibrobacterota bacterium]